MTWKKLGRILAPDSSYEWLATSAGAAFCLADDGHDPSELPVYVSGRDREGRSRIGLFYLDPSAARVTRIEREPVLDLGEQGTFDQNGTGYPCLVRASDGRTRLYYTGWVPAVLVPWQNDVGLATSTDGKSFVRQSRAPIMPRTDAEPLGIGSVHVLRAGPRWRMWYTCFDRWQIPSPQRHFYHIRYAESDDGIDWRRGPTVAVTYADGGEYVLGRPCVVHHNGLYLMWYSYRGASYRIGFAVSTDGITWQRRDREVGIDASPSGWDSEMVCYANVFRSAGRWYMLYNGNGYGRSGLGLAQLAEGDLPG